MSEKPIVGPEDLTPLQRNYLRNLRDYCDTPPTLAKIYAKSWRNTRLLLLVASLGIGAGIWRDLPALSWLTGAFVLGALLRDLGYFLQMIRLWPATRSVINCERLEELLADPPHDNYS